MTLESGSFIGDFNVNYPESNVPASGGDNHLRWIKTAVKNTFPNVTGAITPTHTVINDAIAAVVAATNANTANTLVKRDSSGNFTASTITAALNGNVTGNVLGNVTGNTVGTHTGPVVGNASTATALATSRTITLAGDLTGSASFDGTANATITATIADDSHNHTIANVDGLQSALNGKLGSGSNAVSASKWQTARTLSLSGDASGSVSIDGTANATLSVTVNDDSHNHTIANVDGLQSALNGKLGTSSTATNSTRWNGYYISTSQSGSSSNTIYFRT